MQGITRRRFLQVGGAGVAALSLSDLLFFRKAVHGQEKTGGVFHHACGVCNCNCGVTYRLKNGRVVEFAGNPKDLMGADGKLCVKGFSALRGFHDPCRLKYPLMRTNPEKGRGVDPASKIISWDDAFELVGKKFREAYDREGPGGILLFDRSKPWESHLWNSIGTPNFLCHVDTCTIGFDKLKAHVEKYTPEWAEPITHVPARTLRQVARESGTSRPATLAYHKRDAGGPTYMNSLQTAQAMLTLQALAGTLNRPGGLFFPRELKLPGIQEVYNLQYPDQQKIPRFDDPENTTPLAFKSKKAGFSTAADAILKDGRTRVALFHKYNTTSFTNPQNLEKALKKLAFIVNVDMYMTELGEYADVVLPENYWLENGGITVRDYQAYRPQVLLDEGAKRLFDTKGFAEISNGILKSMGLTQYVVDPKLLKSKQLEALGITEASLRQAGAVYDSEEPFKPKGKFKTPSEKVELYSTVLEKAGHAPLPEWVEPAAKPTKDFPYYIVTHHLPWMRMLKNCNDPVITDLQKENLAHMHPSLAAKIGVKAGDMVWLESPLGKIKIKAAVTEGIRPDTIMTEHGFGIWSRGRCVGCGWGTNEGEILLDRTLEEMKKWKRYVAGRGVGVSDITVNVKRA